MGYGQFLRMVWGEHYKRHICLYDDVLLITYTIISLNSEATILEKEYVRENFHTSSHPVFTPHFVYSIYICYLGTTDVMYTMDRSLNYRSRFK